MPAAVPAIATQAFDSANNTGVGSIVQTTINGITVPAKIVAVASAFPTITGAGLVMDLPALEAFLVSHGATPVAVTQWWLATAGGQVPASLTRALPPGATITSSAALAAATVADPLSAAPQQALLAMAVAAALLAISGFWVSIAANVRQRRAENALLAALGVNQRSAAAQLFLEKLLLSVPAAALGLLLGTVVARLLVPAVTLSPTAQAPVPPPITLFDLPQTIPLAVAVAVLPALAAALVVFRRPTRRPNCARRRRREPALPAPGAVPLAGAAHLPARCSRPPPARGRRSPAGPRRCAQTLAATTPTTRTITVSAAWNDVQGALSYANNANALTSIVPPATIDAITGQLHADFNRAPVSLTPAGTDWSSITTPLNLVNGELPGTGGTPVKIEVTERQPFGPQMRLLSGRFPVATPVPSAVAGTGKPGAKPPAATLQVVMTKQTAATFGLHAGSKFVIIGPELGIDRRGHSDHRPGHGNRGPG